MTGTEPEEGLRTGMNHFGGWPGRQEERAARFLEKHGMYYGSIDREAALASFLADMEQVYSGGSGTVKMIPAYLGEYRPPQGEKTVLTLDIGGTNVRGAAVTLGPEGMVDLRRFTPFLTPGIRQEVDTAEFFGEIANKLFSDPVWQEWFFRADHLGICFSLATVPSRDRDAVMTAGGKQIRIRDMLGKKVGESFRGGLRAAAQIKSAADKAAERTLTKWLRKTDQIDITVINDSVAAALGGYSASGGQSCSGCLGFIYGTGTNLCYREPSGEMINVESGAYCGFPTGDIDDAFDRTLIDAGEDRFEKMVSGGYQGGLMEHILRTAIGEGMLSKEASQNLMTLLEDGRSTGKPLHSSDISEFSSAPAGTGRIASSCSSQEDRDFLLELFDLVTERSACLCGITITGALLRAGIGKEMAAPAFLTAEGSTYLKQKGFREKLQAQMKALAGEKYGLHYRMETIPDAVLRGTAVACLSR